MTALRILLVEDSEDDAELAVQALERGGYEVTFERVETREAMAAALDRQVWDAVASDYSMPEFDAPGAFGVLRERDLDIPFIIVSGTVGEETAVEAMKLGVHDYLLKGKLMRLVPAIQRELRDSAARRAHREAAAALRKSESRFRRLADAGIIGITVADVSGRIVDANDAFLKMVGYSREDLDAGRVDGGLAALGYPRAGERGCATVLLACPLRGSTAGRRPGPRCRGRRHRVGQEHRGRVDRGRARRADRRR
jgi:CheY-like chemotaxis protein